MKKSLICAALLIFISCLAATRSNAQQVFLFSQSSCEQNGVDCESSVELDGGIIWGYSATEVDYWTSDDYSAYVDGELSDQNGLLDAEWDEEYGIAEVYTSAFAHPGTIYTERGYHDVIARYYYEDIEKGPEGCSPCDGCNTDCYYFYDNWYWSDPFGFSFMNGGYFSDWENLYGYGPPAEIENDETIYLGQTSQSLRTPPRVTGISPNKGLITTTVSVTINGNGFKSGATVNAGSGITVSVTSISGSHINASFDIDSQTSTGGNHSVTVTSAGVTSRTSVNFYVQIPTSLSLSIGSSRTHNGGSITDCQGTVLVPVAYGYSRLLTYTVLDQTRAAITQTGMTATEAVYLVSSFPPGSGGDFEKSVSIASNGTFCDVQALYHETSPAPASGEYIKAKQLLNITLPGRLDAVRVNCLNQQHDDVTITDTTTNPNASCQ